MNESLAIKICICLRAAFQVKTPRHLSKNIKSNQVTNKMGTTFFVLDGQMKKKMRSPF